MSQFLQANDNDSDAKAIAIPPKTAELNRRKCWQHILVHILSSLILTDAVYQDDSDPRLCRY